MRVPAFLAFALTLLSAAPSQAAELRIGTLAPRASAWGKVFSKWTKAVKKRSKGKLKMRFYWSGAQGGGDTVVGKLRSGQLDGATLGAHGLGMIEQDALALQMPGLFRSWSGIDRATKALYPDLQKRFDKKGFYLSSIGDVGRARMLTKGREVRVPGDLVGMKPFSPRRGVVAPVVAQVLGLKPIRMSVPEILPGLSSGRINVVTAPPLAAEQLQWAPYFDHIAADVAGVGVGAMVFRKDAVERIPPDLRKIMQKTGKKAGRMLRKRVRKMDDKAYQRLSRRMKVVKLTDAERRQWAKKFAEVRRRLAQGTFSPALVRKLEGLADPASVR